ncbi:glutathione S-transferase family protein [Rhizobium sp. TRM95796]|nr:glutathione S-transferase family protein [Rhizobium sp. TRM95796]
MMSLTLFNYELDDSSYRVRLLLSILKTPHEIVAVDMVPGKEHLSPAMRALSPLGSLPVLREGELTLYGPEAILAYLAKAHDPSGQFLPMDAMAFGETMRWLNFSASALAPAMQARLVALFGEPGDLDALRSAAREAFRVMDDHMTLRQMDGVEWFAAEHATIADVTLFPIFALSRDFGIDHDEFPALRRWIRRFRTLDGFKTMPGIPDYH